MRFNRLNPLLLPSACELMMAVLCLIGIAPANAQSLTKDQQAVVSNAQASSAAIKAQIALGAQYSAALSSAAGTGTIVDPNAHTKAAITDQQRTTYNAALSTYQGTNFYTAQQFLKDQAASNVTQMQQAISSLAAATVDLQKVVSVNQALQNVGDVPTAKQAQQVLSSVVVGTEVTTQQMSNYNTSLAQVNSYASQAAAFMRASGEVTITQPLDKFVKQYGKGLEYAGAVFTYANAGVVVGWADGARFQVDNTVLDKYTQSGDSFYRSVTGFGRD